MGKKPSLSKEQITEVMDLLTSVKYKHHPPRWFRVLDVFLTAMFWLLIYGIALWLVLKISYFVL